MSTMSRPRRWHPHGPPRRRPLGRISITLTLMNRSVLILALFITACGRGGSSSSGSPACGIAALAGPSLVVSQLSNARAVLTDPPRGVPDSMPALVIQQKSRDFGAVIVTRDAEGKTSMLYRGNGFPARGYGLLVVDDTSQRAMGVMVLDQEEPQRHPAI